MPTLIISDTHLGPGRDPRTGLYSPAEDFFADESLAALLDHYARKRSDGDTSSAERDAIPTTLSPPRRENGDTGDVGEQARRHHDGDTDSGHIAEPRHHHHDGDQYGAAQGEIRHHNGDSQTPVPAPPGGLHLVDDHSVTTHRTEPSSTCPVPFVPGPKDQGRQVQGTVPAPMVTPAAHQVAASVTTLVLAGDTFNLWEMNPLDELHQCATGHPVFFDALRRWLEGGNNIFVVPGNHDFQLAFPDVQDALENLLSPPPIRKFANSQIRFGHFYHDPPARLYVEHGDRYTDPRKPGQPPNSYRRDYYFTSALKSRLPVASVYRAHYVSQVLATDPLAMLPAWHNLSGYLFDPAFKLPPRASGENVTLHTINLNIIQANWKRAQSQARLMHTLITTSILLKLAASALPGAALATFLLSGNIPGTLALLAAAAIARTLGAAATHTATGLGLVDLPRAAAEDIAPAVERAGVQTLVFGHSHVPDRAKFGRLTYINTGAWVNIIAPLSAVAPPTRTYAHVDDDGHAQLLQWTDHGPREPIIFRR